MKEITITQIAVPDPELKESPSDVSDFIFALGSAQHSLSKISINFPGLKSKSALRLRDFDAVTHLEIRDYQLLGRSAGKPRLHSVGLPPNMKTLTFPSAVCADEEILELLSYMIENKGVLARNWEEFVVEGGEEGLPEAIRTACKGSGLKVRGYGR